MNDWRSSFYGVNDHEADWEQVFVYLSDEEDGEPVPRWVAYASHDFSGDDLRRRWDDPELQSLTQTTRLSSPEPALTPATSCLANTLWVSSQRSWSRSETV